MTINLLIKANSWRNDYHVRPDTDASNKTIDGIGPATDVRPPYPVPASEVWPRQPISTPVEDVTVYTPAPLTDLKSKLTDYCCREQQPSENEPQVSRCPHPIQPSRAAIEVHTLRPMCHPLHIH
jgi:hypothetical protein